jgi:hypothetical protein
MAQAGFILFIATVLLAIGSGFWSRKKWLPTPEAGTFDIRATADEHAPKASGLDGSMFMRIAVSLLVLGAALFIILSKQYDSDQQKWAFGAIGTVLGYWLKS